MAMMTGRSGRSYSRSASQSRRAWQDELRGRVMSIYTVSFIGLAPLGSLEVGFTGAHLGASVATLICAVIGLGGAFLLLSKRRFLSLDQAGESV